MIRIELDEPTLSRTRIALSPLWETVCSLHLLHRTGGRPPYPYQDWARRAVEAVPATGIGWYPAATDGNSPDFLSPIPAGPTPTIADELTALCETDPATIVAQLDRHHPDGEPPALAPFRTDPGAALCRLADQLLAYHERAIEPYWPALHAVLDEELLHRARALATDGADALLADLHDRVRWQRPVLTLVKQLDYRERVVDKQLLLIPLVFSRGGLMCSTDHPRITAVSYQARGAAVLAGEPAEPAPADRLALLVGRGRATLLRELVAPTSTAMLARRLGLAPSTVSEHLGTLLAAGAVARRRHGRTVLYQVTETGTALLTLLADPASSTVA
ncbi:helix-turn-helix domain-containing protein [Actinocatenispora comari]|uniref:Transcriptional regulator n=1 Tax=Actinocatenispora comari TaxID=2807577 RepID=A0A8J4AF00_9ACTN|nr:helix-turn-helix domain-containing protein [Actinocatenispora comari]GIL29389.1 transcriptional regulator [Actinocatenispora comari]